MTAMNGSVVSRLGRGSLIGCCAALVLALTAFVIAPAAATAQAPPTTTYLALGDSISFGYSQERFNLHFPTEAPGYFDEGFTNDFAADLGKASEVGGSIRLVDDACPGETSNGLIGENEALGGKESTETIEEVEGKPAERFPAGGYQGLGDYHPCKYTYVNHLPLHNGGYINGGKEVSQLEEAVASISNSNSPVKAITLNIGSNDELAAITQCEDEHITEGESAILLCIKNTSEDVTVPHILANIGDILGVIDHVGYTGPIVLLGFYNPDAFVLSGSDALQAGTNAAVEADIVPLFPNVTYANPFSVFNKDAGTNAGKEQASICKYTEMCNPNVQTGEGLNPSSPLYGKDGDIHPSPAGYKELGKLVNKAYLANPAR